MMTEVRLVRLSIASLRHSGVAWLGYTAFVAITVLVIALAVGGVATASELEGVPGDVLRSWTTPAAALATIAAGLLLGSISDVTHSALVLERRSWFVLGLLPWQVRIMVLAQTAVVGACAFTLGIAAAAGIIALATPLSIEGRAVDLEFGSVTVGASGILAGLAVGPSVIRAVREAGRFESSRRRAWVRRALDCIVVIAAVVTWRVIAGQRPATLDEIAGLLPGAIGVLGLLTIAAARWSRSAATVAARVVDRVTSRSTWGPSRLGLRAASSTLATSAGVLAPATVLTSLAGGLSGILSAGDQVLISLDLIGPHDRTVNTAGVLILLMAPSVLALAGCMIAWLMTIRHRSEPIRALLAVGVRPGVLVRMAIGEACVLWVAAVAPGVVAAAVAAVGILVAGRVPINQWAAVAVTPELATVAGIFGLVMVVSAIIAQGAATRFVFRVL